MALPQEEIEALLEHVRSQAEHFKEAEVLFDIYEGDLFKHVEAHMRDDISFQSYQEARTRIAPINVLRKLVDKLSKLYAVNPMREVINGTDQDKELLSWYEANMQINKHMNVANEFFNLFKSFLLEPYVHNGKPQVRVNPDQTYTVWSNDFVDPLNPTHVLKFQGETKDMAGQKTKVFFGYTDERFVIFNDKADILQAEMTRMGNPEGINPFGALPFVYGNRSLNRLIPKHDSDMIKMTLLIPILLSDLNFGAKFQAFSIMFGIDVDNENLKFAPNAFWAFKSDPTTDQKPEVGMFKPQIDIDASLNLIKNQFGLWLSSKGIRPGSVGNLTPENAASGISKIIDEMDTTEERKVQVQFFSDFETRYWDLVMHKMHPVWVQGRMIDQRQLFSPNAKVVVNYGDQLPLVQRGDLIRDLRDEVLAGFTSRMRAIKRLNPLFTESEIEELMTEIDEERTSIIVEETEDGDDLAATED